MLITPHIHCFGLVFIPSENSGRPGRPDLSHSGGSLNRFRTGEKGPFHTTTTLLQHYYDITTQMYDLAIPYYYDATTTLLRHYYDAITKTATNYQPKRKAAAQMTEEERLKQKKKAEANKALMEERRMKVAAQKAKKEGEMDEEAAAWKAEEWK
ncbi:hypothetical protein BDP27DRAFT_1370023 [Rhodocollybia butyracea]|uniref:Uncharacterized protein n=1 Tax=Rhodocollybia butyracea TaxID=206335 RepID=A0A9P5PCV4_9AGAR|nr:hypothetical protein BDP27DRAFT_1370023 [Rhodocollybia butyracea]